MTLQRATAKIMQATVDGGDFCTIIHCSHVVQLNIFFYITLLALEVTIESSALFVEVVCHCIRIS